MAKVKKVKKKRKRKEIQEDLVKNMRTWQGIENKSIASTGRVIEKTKNPIVRLVMEIIQRDSQMHYRVQEWIADSLSGKAVSLTPEELGQAWGLIEEHIKIERRTMRLAQDSLAATEGAKGMLVQNYLLEYLMDDEKKHELLLERLLNIQKGMYPYG